VLEADEACRTAALSSSASVISIIFIIALWPWGVATESSKSRAVKHVNHIATKQDIKHVTMTNEIGLWSYHDYWNPK
jgi:hypothetical protein